MNAALISAIVLSIILLVFNESVKNLISRFFSGLDKSQVNVLFFLLVALCFVAPIGLDLVLEPNPEKQEEKQEPVPAPQKTDAEVAMEAGEKLVELGQEALENKRYKDSVFKANRDEFWVYQIGHIKKGDSAWELYQKIKDNPGVCFFKEGRRKYRVVIYPGYDDRRMMQDSLAMISERFNNLSEPISVENLMEECRKKQTLTDQILEQGNLRVKCYTCEK